MVRSKCLTCAFLEQARDAAAKNWAEARGQLIEVETIEDAIAFIKFRTLESGARLKADLARLELAQHQKVHSIGKPAAQPAAKSLTEYMQSHG